MLGPLIDHKNIFLDSTDFIVDMDYEVSSDKFPTNVRILIFNMLASDSLYFKCLNQIFISSVRDVF